MSLFSSFLWSELTFWKDSVSTLLRWSLISFFTAVFTTENLVILSHRWYEFLFLDQCLDCNIVNSMCVWMFNLCLDRSTKNNRKITSPCQPHRIFCSSRESVLLSNTSFVTKSATFHTTTLSTSPHAPTPTPSPAPSREPFESQKIEPVTVTSTKNTLRSDSSGTRSSSLCFILLLLMQCICVV